MVAMHHLFHSYCENPPLRFSTQDPDENVVLTIRAHPITLLPWIGVLLVALVVPIIIGPYAGYLPLNEAQQLFVILVWYAFAFLYALSNLISWYFNLGIITTKKIIDVDVLNILNSQTTQTLISRVEQVDNKNLGFLSSLFNYGNIFVQTAGEEPNIEYLHAPQPAKIVQIINMLMEKNRRHG